MSERKPYQSDLTDEQWVLIEPVLTAWKNRHRCVSGHQGRYPMREIVNSILFQSRTGCQRALLPNDPPPKSATYYTRTTITGLADRIPAQSADPSASLELPEHPDYPRVPAVFNDTTGPLRARDICQALDFELLPKQVQRTRAKMKRQVTLGILTEAEPGTFSKKQ